MSHAAILFADLAGFTALTEAHGDAATTDLIARFYALSQDALAPSARLIKTIGDAVMLASPEPGATIETALRLRLGLDEMPNLPALRAGLHWGPVIERANDFFGATVNLAARVAAHARSGQILCTRPVAEVVVARSLASIDAIGVVRLRNIRDPVALFEIVDHRRPADAEEIDPVCRMRIARATAPARLPFGGRERVFCSFACAQTFAKNPAAYAEPAD